MERNDFTTNLNKPTSARWSWQSDVDPWKEKDEKKWSWTPYKVDINQIIENSFLKKEKIADIGDYEIDLVKMLQVNKADRYRIRRIKREELLDQSRFSLDLGKPQPVVKKTMNSPFGNVHHFLDFIMKRTPEAYELYQELKTFNLDSTYDKIENVVKRVTYSIQKGAELREKNISYRIIKQGNYLLRRQKR